MPICKDRGYTRTSRLYNGTVYYLGDSTIIKPYIEIEGLSGSRMTVRYHTYFKDQIKNVKLRVIGVARKENATTYESTEFPSSVVREMSDGWQCVVDIPKGARADNTLSFQFTYDDDKDVSVQIQQDVTLPE